jgi:anti-anti-sigma factor
MTDHANNAPRSALQLGFAREGPVAVVTMAGQMDGATATQFTAFLDQHLTDEDRCVVLDTTGLTFLSSAGLRELMLLLRRLAKHQAKPAIFGMTPPVALALGISGFETMVIRAPDRASAVLAVTPTAPEKPGLFSRFFSGGATS